MFRLVLLTIPIRRADYFTLCERIRLGWGRVRIFFCFKGVVLVENT